MTTPSAFGKALSDRRKAMGLTLSKLASLSGLSRQTLHHLERGTLTAWEVSHVSHLTIGVAVLASTPYPKGGQSMPLPTSQPKDSAPVHSVEKPITTPKEIAGACISILVFGLIMAAVAILLHP